MKIVPFEELVSEMVCTVWYLFCMIPQTEKLFPWLNSEPAQMSVCSVGNNSALGSFRIDIKNTKNGDGRQGKEK